MTRTIRSFCALGAVLLLCAGLTAQTLGDFRSKVTGDWNSLGTWFYWNGSGWVDAFATPTDLSGVITIMPGHVVTVIDNRSADQLIVSSGGTLTLSSGTLTVPDGAGIDLDVNGSLNLSGGSISTTGALRLNGGPLNWNAGTIGGGGSLTIASGTVTQNTPWTNTSIALVVDFGTWNTTLGNGTTIAPGGTLTWNSGTIAGPGGFTVDAGATTTLTTGNNKTLNSTLTNSGTINWGAGTLLGSGSVQNATGGVFNINFDSLGQLLALVVNSGAVNHTSSGNFTTSNTFTNSSGGSVNVNAGTWTFAAAWSNAGTLNIPTGRTLFVTSAGSLNAGTIGGGGSLTIASGTVTQNTPWTNNSIALVVDFGTWNTTLGNGTTIAPGGTLTWNGGTIAGPAGFTVDAGATITLATANNKTLNSTLTNSGTINWGAGTLLGSGSVQNATGGVFNINFDSLGQLLALVVNSGAVNHTSIGSFTTSNTFTNSSGGSVNVNAGTWTFGAAWSNAGTLNIPTGRTLFVTVAGSLNAGSAFTGAGTFSVSSTVTQNTPLTNTTSILLLEGGAIWNTTAGNGTTIAPGGTLTWNGGTIAGPAGFTVDAGATATLTTANNKTLNSTLTNSGTINWGAGTLLGSGSVQNATGGVFNINFDSLGQLLALVVNSGAVNHTSSGNFTTSNTFTNSSGGSVNVNAGTWTFAAAWSNAGTLNIPTGRTLFVTVAGSLNAGSAFTGAGTFSVSSTVTQNTPLTNTTSILLLEGGAIWNTTAGNGTTIAPGGTLTWNGGTIAGPGGFTVAAGATATLATANNKTLNSTLTNSGTINWGAGTLLGSGSVQNATGGVFNINFDSLGQLLALVVNSGAVNHTSSGNFTTSNTFTNSSGGSVNVNAGTWTFGAAWSNAGTLNIPTGRTLFVTVAGSLNAGSAFTGAGTFSVSSTVTQNTPLTNTTSILLLEGGAIWNTTAGNGTTIAPGGTLTWNGGTIAGPGGFTVAAGATATLATANNKTLNSTLTNSGTINWGAGTLLGSGSVQNATGGVFNINFDSLGQLLALVVNSGAVNHTSSGNFTTSNTFTNSSGGSVNVNAGTWTFGAASSHAGLLNIGAGRTLTFSVTAVVGGTVTNAGSFAGTITSFTGSSFTNSGSVTLTNLPFAGSAVQTLDGSGSINTLTINNANGVTLGGTQTINTNLTLTNGRITMGNNSLVLGTSATLTGGTAANYCVTNGTGTLRRRVPNTATNVLYPVGLATSYLPVNVQLTAGSTADDFSVRVESGVSSSYDLAGAPTGTPLTTHSTQTTWHINEAVATGSNATVQVQWNLGQEGTGFTRASSTVARYTGSAWEFGAFAAATGSDPYTRSRAGITNFSPFTVSDNVDSDIDGTIDFVDLCPNDADKIVPGVCGCGTPDVATTWYADSDGDGFGDPGAPLAGYTCQSVPVGYVTNSTDLCDEDEDKTLPGICGCGMPDVATTWYADADGDGFGDPDGPLAGYTCQAVPVGYVTNNTDNCPALPGLQGDYCDVQANDPNLFVLGTLDGSCNCVSAPPAETVNLELRKPSGSNTTISWEIIAMDIQGQPVICSGGGYDDSNGLAPIVPQCGLPNGCFRLRVLDSSGDGFGTGGGYQLRRNGAFDPFAPSASNNLRIIDNLGNFTTGTVSSISGGPNTFCIPMSTQKPIFTNCDKLDWITGQYIVAEEDATVSAQWDVTPPIVQPTNTGYEFWFFDPNGGYSFRRFRNHATSDGFGPANAQRARHMRINNWSAGSHIPANRLMNVRIRTRVNGVNSDWGPAYRFMIDPVRAACPLTKLNNIPGDQYESCGQTRQWNTANYVWARPVGGANRYQFRFRLPADNYNYVVTTNNYFVRLGWTGGPPLLAGRTYDVDVRVSRDGGATWCTTGDPWGDVCKVTIANPPPMQGGGQELAEQPAANDGLLLWPNPNNGDQLWLKVEGIDMDVETVTVDIYDLTGKGTVARVLPTQDDHLNTVVDLNGLAAGVYLANITAGEKSWTKRLVIAH